MSSGRTANIMMVSSLPFMLLVAVIVPVLAVLMSSSVSSLSSAATSANWTLYEKNPVLGSEFGVIFDVSLLPPTASVPVYRMYNSWRSGPKGEDIDAIGYCTSKDGLSWPDQTITLPALNDSSWERVINRPSVLHNPQTRQYEMWYTGQSSDHSYIGHAVSPDGVTWTRTSDKPVLEPDNSTWEKVAVMCPNAIFEAAEAESSSARRLRLYYSGGDQYEPDSIGVAFSADGLSWDKSPHNPIFSSNASQWWEKAKVTAAHVFYDVIDHVYYMFYIGFADVDTASINLARSKDGLTAWQRHPANPIISRDAGNSSSWMRDAVYKPFALYDQKSDEWLLWFNGRTGDVEQIGVARKSGHDLGFESTSSSSGSQSEVKAEVQ